MFQSKAACRTEDSSLFFSELESKVRKAKSICDSCPVASSCLRFAIDNEIPDGIFGGLTPDERNVFATLTK